MKLKTLIKEILDANMVQQLLDSIKQEKYERIGAGDNGVVYAINDTDYVFKITNEPDEFAIARVIVNRSRKFSSFIPVHYALPSKKMYIMSRAQPIDQTLTNKFDKFVEDFYKWIIEQEDKDQSIFDYIKVNKNYNIKVLNFIQALEQDVMQIGIPEIELDLDFKSSNIMRYDNRLVLIDW